MQTYILREGVLNDDELLIADEGKIFKGGYKAILKEYFFASEWSNKLGVKKFKKMETLKTYLAKNYTEIEIDYIKFFN